MADKLQKTGNILPVHVTLKDIEGMLEKHGLALEEAATSAELRRVLDKGGSEPADPAEKIVTIKEVEDLLGRHGFKLKKREDHRRIYRKAAELPDPSKGHRAEVNRKTKLVNFRLPPDALDKLERLALAQGVPKATWLASVVLAAIDAQYDLEADTDVEPSQQP
ncbi:putative DNA-binding protein [Sphingobium sp. OAS761]|uniref:hypothetical protein n=1 Tax=Sphingobium sp. OAS761 TaxID=2817901 RepID=UPI0020A07B8B|nr:hypothetical protein [Sphingobium sp. OAS761]MCP1469483.1 putative DNA-binding protein [Sphingobium sp. OAS761]